LGRTEPFSAHAQKIVLLKYGKKKGDRQNKFKHQEVSQEGCAKTGGLKRKVDRGGKQKGGRHHSLNRGGGGKTHPGEVWGDWLGKEGGKSMIFRQKRRKTDCSRTKGKSERRSCEGHLKDGESNHWGTDRRDREN